MAPFFSLHGSFSYAYRVEGIRPGTHDSLDTAILAVAFIKKARRVYLDCKGKKTESVVRKWLKENKPTQFWVKWKTSNSSYHDDSIELYYLD